MKNICFQMTRKAWLALIAVLCVSFPALAQKITVSGTVVDPEGEPLISATVMASGSSVGTATDIDGNYTINVDPDGSLTFSYVGYDPQTIKVDGRTSINVTLKENSVMLDEVVAIGYGVVKKSDATGSVAMVKPDDVEAGMATSAQDLLVGASPGVVVTTNGGQPEGGAQIRIRGGSSLNAKNDPLIVLDGVPLANDGVQGMSNPLAMISPENIENMTILKDASATAIYGSRASNGVIIITTKKGQAGKPQVNFSANMYVNTARKTWDMLDGNAFRRMITEHWGEDSPAVAAMGNSNTDWQDQLLRTTVSQDYSLSVGGTTGVVPYRFSVSYTNNQGILKGSSMERVTAGFNLNPKFFNGLLQVNANVKGYYVRNTFTEEGAMGEATAWDPTRPVYQDWKVVGGTAAASGITHLYNGYSTAVSDAFAFNTNGVCNPLSHINDRDDKADVLRSNGNLQLDYALHFLPELHFNLNLGYDVSKSDENKYLASNSPIAWQNNDHTGAGTHEYIYELRRNTLLDFYANYRKDFEAIKSNLDVMVGYSWQKFFATGRNNGIMYTSPGFKAPTRVGDNTFNLDTMPSDKVGTTVNPASNWANHLQLVSFFGRLNYSFDDTYLLTFTLRDDGTSRFSKENRWGLFPSLALAWKMINMPFLESARQTMNDLKLRLGWGVTGQQDLNTDYFPYMQTFIINKNQGSFYPNMYTGTYVDAAGNPIGYTYYPGAYDSNIKWEETTTWNVGVDAAFLNNRITAALDWYLRETKDLLCFVTVPSGSATSNQMNQNIGSLRNIGLEATITARPVVTRDFTWTTAYNVAWNKNKITKLNSSDDPNAVVTTGGISGATGNTVAAHKVGYAANTFYLFQQVYDENGQPIDGVYVDQNNDGVIDEANDRVLNHSIDPKVTMSWNNNFSYKNWDLGISLRASIGNYVYNNVAAQRQNLNTTWQNSSLTNLINADYYFKGTATTNYYMSDYWLENASFLRCDNITLGYTWPNLLNNALRLRLFGAVQNPFVITKYRGLDPEVAGGIDNNVYPRPITVTFGLVATF